MGGGKGHAGECYGLRSGGGGGGGGGNDSDDLDQLCGADGKDPDSDKDSCQDQDDQMGARAVSYGGYDAMDATGPPAHQLPAARPCYGTGPAGVYSPEPARSSPGHSDVPYGGHLNRGGGRGGVGGGGSGAAAAAAREEALRSCAYSGGGGRLRLKSEVADWFGVLATEVSHPSPSSLCFPPLSTSLSLSLSRRSLHSCE